MLNQTHKRVPCRPSPGENLCEKQKAVVNNAACAIHKIVRYWEMSEHFTREETAAMFVVLSALERLMKGGGVNGG